MPNTYAKTTTAGLSGQQYQIKLATILLIRAYYRKYTNFRVAVEYKDAEKFDDVVLEYDLNENNSIKYYIQLKHSESQNALITEEQLTNATGDFCLAKYLHSYMKIVSKSKKSSNKLTKTKYIIFTNIKLDGNVKNSFRQIDHDAVLEFNQGGEFGKIYSNKILEKVKEVAKNYELYILAQELLDHISKKEPIRFQNGGIFYKYLGLFGEVLDTNSKKFLKFNQNFIVDVEMNSTLTQRFQTFLKEALQTRSQEFLDLFQQNVQNSNLAKTDVTIEVLSEYVQKVKIKLSNFKLKDDAVLALPEAGETDIKYFFDHLIFAVGQPTESQMDDIILEEIRNGGKMQLSKTGQQVVACLSSKMTNWYKEKQGRFLRKLEAETMLNEIFDQLDVVFKSATKTHLEKLNSFRNIQFKNNNKVLLEFLGQSDSSLIICCSNKKSTILTALKVYQSLQVLEDDYYFVSIENILQFLEDVEYHNKSKLFIIDLENSENCCHLQKILIAFVEKNCINKSIIISPGTGESITKQYQKLIDSTTFDELTEDSQQILLRTKIVFQGAPIPFQKLLLDSTKSINKILNEECMIRLLNGDLVSIGRETSKVYPYHIERNLWSEDNGRKFTEDQLIGFCTKEQNVLISDVAGMGKSSLLTSLIAKYKQNNANFWVIRIDLNDCTDALQKFSKNPNFHRFSGNIIIWELSRNNESTDTLSRSMFDYYFENLQNRIVLMFDGFDEVCPDYDEITIEIIKKLNDFKIYLTTRPETKMRLIAELELKAFRFESFSKENQKELLRKYWSEKLPTEETKLNECVDAVIEKFANSINDSLSSFTGIPLQIMLIAEYFLQTELKHVQEFFSDFKREFAKKRLNILELYQMFIESKFEIMLHEKGKIPKNNVFIKSHIDATKEELINFHKQLALYTIFSKELIMKVDGSFNANLEKQYPRISKFGLVTASTSSIQFHHRTFAEYFVALLLIDEESGINRKLHKSVLQIILTAVPSYKVIRTFMHEMLHQEPKIKSGRNFTKAVLNFSEMDKTSALMRAAEEGHATIVEVLLNCGVKVNSVFQDRTALHFSAFYQHTEIVKMLLAHNADVNAMDDEGRTALHLAAFQGHSNIVEILLEHDAKMNLCNMHGETALHKAAFNGHSEIVELLLKHGGEINLISNYGNTALHRAAFKGHTHTVELLLEHGADATVINNSGETALHLAESNSDDTLKVFIKSEARNKLDALLLEAASNGRSVIVKELLEHGADNKEWNEALHAAAINGHAPTVEVLLNFGGKVNVNDVDQEGKTAMHWAAYNGHADTVRALLDHKAEVNAVESDGRTALHMAVINGHSNIVRLLMERGGDVNAVDNDGNTALHWAACNNEHSDIVEILLGRNAEVDAVDIDGQTALHKAAINGCADTVKVLIKHGASVGAVDRLGNTAVHFAACNNEHFDNLKILLEEEVDVNAVDRSGRTALHKAAIDGHLDIVKVLVEHGAVDGGDKDGSTAMDHASLNGHLDVKEYLLQHRIINITND